MGMLCIFWLEKGMIHDVLHGVSAVKRSRIHPSLVPRPNNIASPLWRSAKNKSISNRVLQWISAVALAAWTVLQPLCASPANGQAFKPDPARSKPEPSFATYDCHPFFPNPDQKYLPKINAVRISLEGRHGSGVNYWQGIESEDALLDRLQEGREASKLPTFRGDIPMSDLLQWEVVLYTHCRMLNDSIKMKPADSSRYLEWLEAQYERQISNTGPQTNAVDASNGTCAMDAPLPPSVIKMWLAWNIFKNRLYGIAEKLAQGVEEDTSSDAQQLESTLGPVPSPQPGPNYEKEKCEVLGHGPLNDAAAAAWVEAMSFYCTGRDSEADVVLARLRSLYHEGQVYNRRNFFWRPAETYKSCP
jgi:hypothetical protein